MADFWLGVLGNIVAALIIAALPIALLLLRVNRRQRDAAAFFGVRKADNLVRIELSRYQPEVDVEVLRSGAQSTGWIRETVEVNEFKGAQAIGEVLSATWTRPRVAQIVNSVLEGSRRYGAIEVAIQPAADSGSLTGAGPIIVMGTGVKASNAISERFLGEASDPDYSAFRFIKDPKLGRGFERLQSSDFAQQFFYSSYYEGLELAVIQRITVRGGPVVFLCAGKDSPGTLMAANYLASTWRDLYARYRRQATCDFAHLYLFDERSPTSPRLLVNSP